VYISVYNRKWVNKMARKTISLSIEEEIYEKYRKICDERGWILSKQVENFIVEEIKKNGGKNGRD